MGNKQPNGNIIFTYENQKALDGEHTIVYKDRTYKGEFRNGYFIKGAIFNDDEEIIEQGEFERSKMVSGEKQMSLSDVLCNHKFISDVGFAIDFDEVVYAVGRFENDMLEGKCEVYYDSEHTDKAVIGDFENGILIEGDIYHNGKVVEHGMYRYENDENSLMAGSALMTLINPLSCGPNDKEIELYKKKADRESNDDAGTDDDTESEPSNEIEEYYYDRLTTQKALVYNDDVSGDVCEYYDVTGNLLYRGEETYGVATNGVIFYKGNYVQGVINKGVPQGSVKIYKTENLAELYAEGCYTNGNLVGWVQYYTTSPPKKVLYDLGGNLVDEVNDTTCVKFYDKWVYNVFNKNLLSDLLNESRKLKSLKKTVEKIIENQVSQVGAYDYSQYRKALMQVLNNPELNQQDPNFAQDVLTVINEEYSRYCEISKACGVFIGETAVTD